MYVIIIIIVVIIIIINLGQRQLCSAMPPCFKIKCNTDFSFMNPDSELCGSRQLLIECGSIQVFLQWTKRVVVDHANFS